jgi:hypothetical protein
MSAASSEKKRSLWGIVPAALAVAIPTMMQVGPDDAIINLCKWPRKAWPSLAENCLPGISPTELYVLAIFLFAVGIIWITKPYRTGGTRRHKMAVGLSLLCFSIVVGIWGMSILASSDVNSTKAVMLPPESSSSVPPKNLPSTPPDGYSSGGSHSDPNQTGTRIAVWQNINRQMDELSKLLNAGYSMLDGWPQNVRADREKEIQNWVTLVSSFENLRAKLDRLRDSYDDREITDVLRPVMLPPGRPLPPYTLFHSLGISIDAFLAQIRSINGSVPDNIEDEMRAYTGLVLRDMNRLAKWKSDTQNTSGVRAKELSLSDPPSAKQPSKQLTMKDLLSDEFPGVLRHEGARTYNFNDDTSPFTILVVVYQDPRSGGEFLGFYVPGTPKTAGIVEDVFRHHIEIMNAVRGTGTVEIRGIGEPTGLNSKDTKFSGRVFVYYENEMTLQELAALDTFARTLGLKPTFRDQTYLMGRQQIQRDIEAHAK